jgi:hypothetical protein
MFQVHTLLTPGLPCHADCSWNSEFVAPLTPESPRNRLDNELPKMLSHDRIRVDDHDRHVREVIAAFRQRVPTRLNSSSQSEMMKGRAGR